MSACKRNPKVHCMCDDGSNCNQKPEALRLARELEACPTINYKDHAAELRRLHAENERLRQINQAHEMKLSVRGYEIQIEDLKAALEQTNDEVRMLQEQNAYLDHKLAELERRNA